MKMNDLIAVIIESHDSVISPVSYEAMTCAEKLSEAIDAKIIGMAIGENAREIAQSFASATGHRSIAIILQELAPYNPDAYKSLIFRTVRSSGAKWVFVAGTTWGFDFAPGLAVKLGLPCVSSVQEIIIRDSRPVFRRSMFGGKVTAEFTLEGTAVVITQPGQFKRDGWLPTKRPEVTAEHAVWNEDRIRFMGTQETEQADSSLAEASVIVCAGRGIRSEENLERLREMAGLFTRSAVAGSRPVCDERWLPHAMQVGQTGTTVTPDLFIACGVSGAQQHIAGMLGSRFVVAINTDPEAPIFNHADIGIVEDLESFIDCFVGIVRKDHHVTQANHGKSDLDLI